tara:strand:+ start:1079 stop:1276 length:198 start_codon:yes stop_codon:yes gene_type:complete
MGDENENGGCGTFACLGAILAVVLSWIVNKSILWAILHFIFGWLYCIYWALTKTGVYEWLSGQVV